MAEKVYRVDSVLRHENVAMTFPRREVLTTEDMADFARSLAACAEAGSLVIGETFTVTVGRRADNGDFTTDAR